jgi:hypothetical protein
MFSKMLGGAATRNPSVAACDPQFEKRWPCIFLMMTSLVDDEKKARQTCTLTVVCEDGRWKGGLKERDHAMSVWRGADTLEGLLDALEAILADGSADWRKTEYKSRK